MACALYAVKRGSHKCGHAESENNAIGVQRSQTPVRQPGLIKTEIRPDEFRGNIDARRHTEDGPRERTHDEKAYYAIVVVLVFPNVLNR